MLLKDMVDEVKVDETLDASSWGNNEDHIVMNIVKDVQRHLRKSGSTDIQSAVDGELGRIRKAVLAELRKSSQ